MSCAHTPDDGPGDGQPCACSAGGPKHRSGVRPLVRTALLLLFWVHVAGACTPDREPSLRLSVDHVDQAGADAIRPDSRIPFSAAQARQGQIYVHGFMVLPDHCDRVEAELAQRDSVLVLRITARDRRGHTIECGSAGRTELARYDARVESLPPGVYRLQVLYDYGQVGRGSPEPRSDEGNAGMWSLRTVLDERVVVD